MRVLFAIPGLHRYDRGAEVAFIAIAEQLAKAGDIVTLIGAGTLRGGMPYRFVRAGCIGRENFESFPALPVFRNEFAYEELTFIPGLLRAYHPAEYDVTVTCSYPFTNWALRRPSLRKPRPPHVFVTQNGDWPAFANQSEYIYFGCEGLVCTNPDFFERNKTRWRCRMIPNGVDLDRFRPRESQRAEFGLPAERLIVLMVSALAESKRVEVGIEAVSKIPGAHLVVAGDGPLRRAIDAQAAKSLPGRFTRLSLSSDKMPSLYQSADVFLHLSKEESFGNVYVEALASGLPIVAHDSPRLRWLLGEDEYLLDTNDVSAIAHSISRARSTTNLQCQERVARAGLYSWPRIAALYREFLHEVIDENLHS